MTDKQPDAIALLKADHRAVEQLFEDFEKAKGEGKKRSIAERICLELTVHTKIEEEIFYPACEGKVDDDVLKEAFVEHDGAKILIAEIEAIEVRLLERQPATVNDIFSPPVVQLVALSARVGDRRRVKTWQLDGVAARPMLARWFGTIPELQRTL